MKVSWMYRAASILLILFAAGHTLGFREVDPRWGIDALVNSMKAIRFDAQGFSRTYWDFYAGFGLFVSVQLLFAALVCWQLSALDAATLRALPWLCWSLVVCFAGVTILSWKYFFVAPLVFSLVITLCLILGALLAGKTT
jgi:hypothetical protein